MSTGLVSLLTQITLFFRNQVQSVFACFAVSQPNQHSHLIALASNEITTRKDKIYNINLSETTSKIQLLDKLIKLTWEKKHCDILMLTPGGLFDKLQDKTKWRKLVKDGRHLDSKQLTDQLICHTFIGLIMSQITIYLHHGTGEETAEYVLLSCLKWNASIILVNSQTPERLGGTVVRSRTSD